MTRRLSDQVKSKRVRKKAHKMEDGKDLPSTLQHSMVQGLYRIGWDKKRIIAETGIPRDKVYRDVKHFEEDETWSRSDASIKPEVIANGLANSRHTLCSQEVQVERRAHPKDWIGRAIADSVCAFE